MDDTCRRERDFLRNGIQEAFLCSELVSKYINKGPERDAMIRNMDGLVQNYCMLDKNLEIRPDLFQKMKHDEERRILQRENAEGPVDDSAIDYHKNLTDAVSKAMKNVKSTQHVKYKDFKKKVDKLLKKDGAEDEDDLEVTEETNNLVDPLSKAILVDPVITVRCKHRFSRRSIMSMMQGKHAIQCPYVACKDKFTVDELEDDLITAQALKRMQLAV